MKIAMLVRCAVAAAFVSALSGCMSMEEKLASDSQFWRDIGESEAVGFVLDTANPLEKRLEIVPKIANQQKLAKIVIAKNAAPEIKNEARKRIDEVPALATIALEAPDSGDRKDALGKITKSEDARIEAAWIFAERKPSSDAQRTLLEGLSADGTAKFAKSFTARIDAAVEAGQDAEKMRKTYGDMMAKGKLKEQAAILKSLVKLAPFVEDENTIAAILRRRDVSDARGTEYDFLTPLEGALQKAVAARMARERAAFLAALDDGERVILLNGGRIEKQGKTVNAVDGTATPDSGTSGSYRISRKDVLAGIKDAGTAKMMAKKEAKRELDKAVASKMMILDSLDASDRIETVKTAKAGEFREELARKVLAKYPDEKTFQGVLPFLPAAESTDIAYKTANGFLDGKRISAAKAGFAFGMVADEKMRGELDAKIVDMCKADFAKWDSLKKHLSPKVDIAATEAMFAELRRQAAARAEAEKARQAELRRQAVARFIENAKNLGAEISAKRIQGEKEAIADSCRGRGILFKGAGVWNANCSKPLGNTSALFSDKAHYTLLTTGAGDTFYCAFAEPYAAKPKTFKNFQDEKFTLFAIVTGDKQGFTFCTVGGLVKDENDIKGMEKIIETYGVEIDTASAAAPSAKPQADSSTGGQKAGTAMDKMEQMDADIRKMKAEAQQIDAEMKRMDAEMSKLQHGNP